MSDPVDLFERVLNWFGRWRFWRIYREAEAKVRYRPSEQLRHTMASTLLSRNAPLLYVQHQGGWRSASVLLKVYARWMPQDAPTVTPMAPALRLATTKSPESLG